MQQVRKEMEVDAESRVVRAVGEGIRVGDGVKTFMTAPGHAVPTKSLQQSTMPSTSARNAPRILFLSFKS